MCGRFAQTSPPAKTASLFQALSRLGNAEPRYNVAPTTEAAVVRRPGGGEPTTLEMLTWGLVPPWAKDPAMGAKLFNARSETAAEKPSFKGPLKSRRCLVPVDGFFEWKRTGEAKQPFYFTMRDGQPFALAGLWEDRKGAKATFTILTVGANPLMAEVHDRMPVILDPGDWAAWLDPAVQDVAVLQALMKPYPADKMACRAVSSHVNSSRNQGPQCLEPPSGADLQDGNKGI